MRTSAELREGFLSFFEEKGHLRCPSASLIPRADDHSTLLTSAGMQPQMPFFLEREPPPAPVTRLELELSGASPATGQQLPLFVPQALHGARLAWQLARLALTYGEDRVRRVELADPEAPLPERRWAWRSVTEAG
jgi:hypothetical protein